MCRDGWVGHYILVCMGGCRWTFYSRVLGWMCDSLGLCVGRVGGHSSRYGDHMVVTYIFMITSLIAYILEQEIK